MTKEEKTIEKIALLLLKLELDEYEQISYIAHEALDMAIRATKAEDDPSWWEIIGRPDFNQRMKHLRTKVEKS